MPTTQSPGDTIQGRREKGGGGLIVEGTAHNRPIQLLVDTGASVNLLSTTWWSRNGDQRELSPTREVIYSVNGRPMRLWGETTIQLRIGARVEEARMVVADIGNEAILGSEFLRRHRLMVDMATEQVIWGDRTGVCRVASARAAVVAAGQEAMIEGKVVGTWTEGKVGLVEGMTPPPSQATVIVGRGLVTPHENRTYVRVLNPGQEPVVVYKGMTLGIIQEAEKVATDPAAGEATRHCRMVGLEAGGGDQEPVEQLIRGLVEGTDEEQKEGLATLLRQRIEAFQRDKEDKGHTDLAEHRIDTAEALPIKQPPRRLAPHRREAVEEEVEKMLAAEVIEESQSPWASPVVLVKKKDGSTRFCVDYRRLNAVTVKDAYPLPRVEDCLDTMAGANWFSTLDLASGYWQLDIEEGDREKTAFTTHRGLYQFRRMPFGLCNAPGTFERVMEIVMRGLQWKTCLVYLDDIVVFSNGFDQHLERLGEVLGRLIAAGLKVKPSKCQLARREVGFLGHVVSHRGVSTDPEKIVAVEGWPAPGNVTEVRSFLGLAGYYRAFVPDFATIAKPLSSLAEKGKTFSWTEECTQAFEALKRKLVEAPILAFPQEEGGLVLDTDASDTGLGAVLSQEQDGMERVLAYGSRTLSKPEKNYCVTRRELLAIVFGLRKFRHYLVGRPVLVRTDHASLRWLLEFKEPEGQLARWLQVITTYDLRIQHRPGKLHGNADGLSRRPCKQCGRDEDMGEMDSCRVVTRGVARKRDGTGDPQAPAVDAIQDQRVPANGGETRPLEIDWAQEQAEDALLREVQGWLAPGQAPAPDDLLGRGYEDRAWANQLERLRLVHGVLGRYWTAPSGHHHFQIAVPKSQRKEVLYQCHGAPMAGHLGRTRTVRRLQQAYYWPDFRRDATVWCARCEPCIKRKSAPPPHRAAMGHVPTGLPMQRVAIDIMGPLPRSDRGNRFIMVVGDYFTKWTEAFPLVNQEAGTVARELVEQFVCRFGPPAEIHTDQGRNFQSALFKEILALLEIRQTRTCAFRPQSDGMIERANRTIEMLLATTVAKDQRDWDTKLPYVMAAYRSSAHSSTNVSPNMMMLGRETTAPMGLLYPLEAPPPDPQGYVAEMQLHMATAYEYARGALGRSVERQRRNYDARAGPAEIAEGATVYYFHPLKKLGLSPKLQSYWTGPWKVIKRISAAVYVIRAGRVSKTVHFDALKVTEAAMEINEGEEEEVVQVVRLARRQRLEEWVPPGWSPPGMRRSHPGSMPEEEGFHISEDSETDSLNSEPMSEGEEAARRGRNDERALQRDRRAANPAFWKANKEWDRLLLEYERYEEEMETARGENLANLRIEHARELAATVLKENNQDGDQSAPETLRQQPEGRCVLRQDVAKRQTARRRHKPVRRTSSVPQTERRRHRFPGRDEAGSQTGWRRAWEHRPGGQRSVRVTGNAEETPARHQGNAGGERRV